MSDALGLPDIPAEGQARYRLFFSSCFRDPVSRPLHIRKRVRDLNTGDEKPIWLAEDFQLLKPKAPTPPLDKALFCVEGVRRSDAYVAVVRHRHGSGVEVSAEDHVQASYFELELFEAALLRKPAFVFLLKGGEPSPRMLALLRLLSPALPGICWEPLSEDEIVRRIAAILEPQASAKTRSLLPRAASNAKAMATQLTSQRHRPYDPRRDTPPIEFLGGLRDLTLERPDPKVVERVLERAESEVSHHDRLTLLWTAIRDLMGAGDHETAPREFLPLWDRALGSWNNAGAWYGLHGHPLMGCLASLSSLARMRERLGNADRPHGPLSSEYYSIAKRVGGGQLKRDILDIAYEHIAAAIDEGENSAKLAQRGSVLAALGNRSAALRDYEQVVALRTDAEGASDQQRGDAHAELGFALVLSGRIHRGIAEMERGVDLLSKGPPSGFLIRALRKLGRAYLIAGAPHRALDTLNRAHDLAGRLGAYDQLSKIDRIASALHRGFGKIRA